MWNIFVCSCQYIFYVIPGCFLHSGHQSEDQFVNGKDAISMSRHSRKSIVSTKGIRRLVAAFAFLAILSLFSAPRVALASTHSSGPQPNDPPENNCITVQMSITHPTIGVLIFFEALTNNCGGTITNVTWGYTSDIICGGEVLPGPANAGNTVNLADGQYQPVTSERWTGILCRDENGDTEGFLLDYFGQGNGKLAGNPVTGHTQGSKVYTS
jgi:hypothetical protein